jgi:hypothetical protein
MIAFHSEHELIVVKGFVVVAGSSLIDVALGRF